MRYFTPEEARALSFKDAKDLLMNNIYEATGLLELMEGHQLQGNGHHMRQELAQMAAEYLEKRWRK